MSQIVTVVQARFASTRLPGKILLPLCGEPLLVRMVRRVQAAKLAGHVVVATTTDSSDDATLELCRAAGIPCYRGHPLDLLDRHFQCAKWAHADVVLKIPSDCPLIDPAIIDRVIDTYLTSGADFASNLHPPSYPDGMDVEVMSLATLERAWKEATKDFEREHTTPYIWERPERFGIANVSWETGQDFSMTHRLTIDYREDYELIRSVYEALFPRDPQFGLGDILQLLELRPDIRDLNSRYVGVNWYRHHLGSLKTIRPDQTKVI
jgi:spore coat polysaccharide biosynthesis protein SpsF